MACKNFSNTVDLAKMGIPEMQADISDLKDKSLPDVDIEDAGKILKVDDAGKWAVGTDSGLPDVTSSDEGKILTVNSSGEWDVEDPASTLPDVTSSDNGKVLQVVNGKWNKSNTTLDIMQSEISNIEKTLSNLLNPPTEKIYEWDFTGATPLVDTINGKTATSNNVTCDSNGAYFNARDAYISMSQVITTGRSFKIEFGNVNITNEYENVCVAHTCQDNNNPYGFLWAANKQNYVYGKSSDIYLDLPLLNNINLLKNGTLEVKRTALGHAELYVNNQYLGELSGNDWIFSDSLTIGCNGISIVSCYVKKVTIYG